MAKWHFKKHDGYSDINQSSSAEAFEGSAAKGLAQSIIRESIQNVLDVANDPAEPARIRFTLIEDPNPSESRDSLFKELMTHLHNASAGTPDPPKPNESCRFLLIEDFNTSGLTGDYRAPYIPGTENNFVNFLYHDGLTGKSGKKLGSRGVGKIVFLIASRARTLFAYTIRVHEGSTETVLAGKSLLKFRQVNGSLFEPAGYFIESWGTDSPRQPITSRAFLETFSKDFSLSRKSETGLSIVVPFVDSGVTLDNLRQAAIEEYHFAILNGTLKVELSDGITLETIDTNTLPESGDPELSARISLCRFAIANPSPSLSIAAPEPGKVQRLLSEHVSEEVKQSILHALNQKEKVAVRLRLNIHPKEGPPVETSFDVYLEAAVSTYSRPSFIRDLLPISGEGLPCAQVRSLVLIRPGPLADFLRAAEGANHTQWSPRTDNFKKTYKGRLSEIEFVNTCVNRLIEIVRGNADEPVGGISTFFFSAPVKDSTTKASTRSSKKPGTKPEVPQPPIPEHELLGYVFSAKEGGFTICGSSVSATPKRITVRVAYDVMRGSPWSEYEPDDFDFRKERGPVRIAASNAEVTRTDPGNRLIIKPKRNDFEVVVTGFNKHLDLIVDHRGSSKNKHEEDTSDAS